MPRFLSIHLRLPQVVVEAVVRPGPPRIASRHGQLLHGRKLLFGVGVNKLAAARVVVVHIAQVAHGPCRVEVLIGRTGRHCRWACLRTTSAS